MKWNWLYTTGTRTRGQRAVDSLVAAGFTFVTFFVSLRILDATDSLLWANATLILGLFILGSALMILRYRRERHASGSTRHRVAG